MLFFGRRLLPDRASLTQSFHQVDLHDTYELAEQMWQVRVTPGSRLANQTVQESDINAELGLTVAAVWRGREAITIPKSNQMIYAADELLIVGREDRLEQLLAWGIELIEGGARAAAAELPIEPIEIMIAPRSNAIGRTLSANEAQPRRRLAGDGALARWTELPHRCAQDAATGRRCDFGRGPILRHSKPVEQQQFHLAGRRILGASHRKRQSAIRRRHYGDMVLALAILQIVPTPHCYAGREQPPWF